MHLMASPASETAVLDRFACYPTNNACLVQVICHTFSHAVAWLARPTTVNSLPTTLLCANLSDFELTVARRMNEVGCLKTFNMKNGYGFIESAWLKFARSFAK